MENLLDTDIIRIERDGIGSAQAHVQRPGDWPEGWIVELPRRELFQGAGFDFGAVPGTASPTAACQNLSYSILRACLPADVAREWRMWFAAGVVMGGKEPRWEVAVGDVRSIIEQAARWFVHSTPARRGRAAMLDGPASWAEEEAGVTLTF